MRLRTKRAVPVANDNQLPLPFAGRTRPGTAQLRLPAVPDIPLPLRGKDWNTDLAAVQGGRMDFDTLVKRHGALLRQVVRPWVASCPANFGPEDLLQEALIEVMHGVRTFDPTRGVPLHHYVRTRMKNRLLSLTSKLRKGVARETRFLAQQIVEEKVVVLRGRPLLDAANDYVAAYEAVAPKENPDGFDAARTAARIVGGLPSKQARVVAGIVFGQSADDVTLRVYGAKCKRPRKAALRAFAAAHRQLESSTVTAEDRQRTNHDDDAHESSASEKADSQTTFGFSRQVAPAHAGQGE